MSISKLKVDNKIDQIRIVSTISLKWIHKLYLIGTNFRGYLISRFFKQVNMNKRALNFAIRVFSTSFFLKSEPSKN